MKRLIIHWTAGRYYPTLFEKEYYHFLIDKDGVVYKGNYTPEDNLNCEDGRYAKHTGGGNTGSIGVALCAMSGFSSPGNVGMFPITKVQFEACMKFCAYLCEEYSIPVIKENVMTHYEFGKSHPNTTSAGKIDITYLPPYKYVGKDDVGNFIRSKIRWYKIKNLRG